MSQFEIGETYETFGGKKLKVIDRDSQHKMVKIDAIWLPFLCWVRIFMNEDMEEYIGFRGNPVCSSAYCKVAKEVA